MVQNQKTRYIGETDPQLIPLSKLRDHIITITGVKISEGLIKRWIKTGELRPITPYDRRRKYITKANIDGLIEKYSGEPEEISEELKPYLMPKKSHK